MCGIFGHTHPSQVDINHSREALNLMEHRGPDQWDDWKNQEIYLGHRRLSILDLSENGKQPMLDAATGVVITVNGEIYNFQSIKKSLKGKYPFKSTSDSEVLLYAYIEWGLEVLLDKIDGMYAITIYDPRIKKCFLVRDRSGIKPLFYAHFNGVTGWASELKSLSKLFEKELTIDTTAVYDFLTYLYIPCPKTLYNNIFKLKPAHYLEIDLATQQVATHKYWELSVDERSISLEEAKTQFLTLFEKSIQEQLISDVPIGFFLSGGIDSSTVVAAAANYTKNINTYTIGFSDKGKDETAYSQIVSKLFDTNHTVEIFDEDYSDLINQIFNWYDEPYGDTSAMPTYLVSALAKKHSTVVLTGDGGDELFGGYTRYFYFKNTQSKPKIKSKRLKRLIKQLSKSNNRLVKSIAYRLKNNFVLDDLELYTQMLGGMLTEEKTKYRKALNIPADYDDYWYYRKYYKENLPVLTRLQYLDFHTYLHDDILTKVDRASMQVSLECRVPYLSKDIIEFAFSLPENIRYAENHLKGILKKTFEPKLPDEILYRKKAGFSVPNKFFETRGKEQFSKPEILLEKYNSWDESKKLKVLLQGTI